MNKLVLNDKLARLYNITGVYYPIDTWDILMNLAVDNGINYVCYKHYGYCKAWIGLREEDTSFAFAENLKDHESPQDATRFAIAMALVELKEG